MDEPDYEDFRTTTCFTNVVKQDTDSNDDDDDDYDNDPPYIFNEDIFQHGWQLNLDELLGDNENQANQNHLDANEKNLSNNNNSIDIQSADNQIVESGADQYDTKPILAGEGDILKQNIPKGFQISKKSTTLEPGINFQQNPFTPDIKSPNKRRKLDIFNDAEFTRILNQQLRQHIQLLSQTILLTKNTIDMKHHAKNARIHLNSYIKVFENKPKPSNLLHALNLVDNLPTPRYPNSSVRVSWRHIPIPDGAKRVLATNSNIFMYKKLMPEVAFSSLPAKLIPKKSKINFTPNEDKLLAFALNEFKGESSQYALIASLLMLAKTKIQISNHIKNIKRSPGNEDNPIKLYYSQGDLPQIDLDSDSELRLAASQTQADKSDADLSDEIIESKIDAKLKCETSPVSAEEETSSVIGDFLRSAAVQTKPFDVSKIQQETDADVHKPHVTVFEVVSDREHELDAGDECRHDNSIYHDDMMNMDLDDLMAASTTISKSACTNSNQSNNRNNNNPSSENNKIVRNSKLKRSMLNLMSYRFLSSQDMGDLIIQDFIKTAQDKLSERNYIHLLQLLTNLMKKEIRLGIANNQKNNTQQRDDPIVKVFYDISEFLTKINAPEELRERLILFLNIDQATKCNCAFNYLHWMRFFEFIQHVEMYHDGDGFEKKLMRLIDALQKDDPHKVKLAAANLVNKHPLLKREFDGLSLDGKPHPSLFLCDEDFDDITEPITMLDKQHRPTPHSCNTELLGGDTNGANQVLTDEQLYESEHFQSKPNKDEMNYASQSCPCQCHKESITTNYKESQHCKKCNLKFIKGKMYLVNKIKPILAEWSYAVAKSNTANNSPKQSDTTGVQVGTNLQQCGTNSEIIPAHTLMPAPQSTLPVSQQSALGDGSFHGADDWTFEEDKEILEFCQSKAEQNEETMSFDSSIFEELVERRRKRSFSSDCSQGNGQSTNKKSARQIAERFNHLMEMYSAGQSVHRGLGQDTTGRRSS